MKYSAVVIGATGLTGSKLVELLFENEQYERVITLSRKRTKLNHRKHESHIVDLFDPTTYAEFLKADHLFICTGTTQAKTPEKEKYYRIEHDLPVQVAQVALENGVKKVIAISALGADPESRFMYNRGKGEMERDIEKLGFQEAYFVQPALIGGEREEQRKFESAWKKFQKLIDPLLIGYLKKYRTIEPETIAQSMIYIAVNGYEKFRIESDELKVIAFY
ncbi:MAG: NAD-dependent epimerase/dehydratase family protein [Nonlabens sp.]|uniref:NAD-dependent epimerase/dehydratase family protein n=1 Tax=Nonlabens sp. TaxID=1888209 RepID=UPI003EFA6B54